MGKSQLDKAETVVVIDVLHHIKPVCKCRGRKKDAKNSKQWCAATVAASPLLEATMSLRCFAVVGRRIADCCGFVACCSNEKLQLNAL